MSSDEEDMFEISKKIIAIEKLLDNKKISKDSLSNDALSKEIEEIASQIRDIDEYLTDQIETLEKDSDIYSELQVILAPYYDELVDLTDKIDKQADTTVNLRKMLEIFKENVLFLFDNLLDIEKRILNLQA